MYASSVLNFKYNYSATRTRTKTVPHFEWEQILINRSRLHSVERESLAIFVYSKSSHCIHAKRDWDPYEQWCDRIIYFSHQNAQHVNCKHKNVQNRTTRLRFAARIENLLETNECCAKFTAAWSHNFNFRSALSCKSVAICDMRRLRKFTNVMTSSSKSQVDTNVARSYRRY